MDKVTFFSKDGVIHETVIARGNHQLLREKINMYLFNRRCQKIYALLVFFITGGYLFCILWSMFALYQKRITRD